jgi:hypothetical protein
MTLTILFILLTIIVHAPIYSYLPIIVSEPTQPYEAIWRAVCQVESSNDPLAYNKNEHAVGIAQIRQCRVDDFNKQTGKNYKLQEMYCPVKSKEVFLFFADKLQTPDLIIRKWNGSGVKTYSYLAKVQGVIK